MFTLFVRDPELFHLMRLSVVWDCMCPLKMIRLKMSLKCRVQGLECVVWLMMPNHDEKELLQTSGRFPS